MTELSKVKKKIAEMSRLALSMWRKTFQAFMDHDMDLLSGVLEDESRLNDMEKEITADLIAISRAMPKDKSKKDIMIYEDVTEGLELIGDYCKDILERVQIKIEEKLLFVDESVKEYTQLYRMAEDALDKVTCALEQDYKGLAGEVLKKSADTQTAVDSYKARHTERVISGVCRPFECNMFANMLDFTALAYKQAEKIAQDLLKIDE